MLDMSFSSTNTNWDDLLYDHYNQQERTIDDEIEEEENDMEESDSMEDDLGGEINGNYYIYRHQ